MPPEVFGHDGLDQLLREARERLQVLEDYPTPPNCTSPYAPIWIAEMVRRRSAT